MADAAHWQQVYTSKASDAVSWYRPHLDRSLALIDGLALAPDAPILDVGAGASTLVDDLLARGLRDVTVNDLADAALDHTRARIAALPPPAQSAVRYLAGDITTLALPAAHYALWHDRAAFHFLTEPAQRRAYVAQAARSLRPGGQGAAYAVRVSDAFSGQGLGRRLMECLMAVAREQGLKQLDGLVLVKNHAMLRLMRSLGFSVQAFEDDEDFKLVSRTLNP